MDGIRRGSRRKRSSRRSGIIAKKNCNLRFRLFTPSNGHHQLLEVVWISGKVETIEGEKDKSRHGAYPLVAIHERVVLNEVEKISRRHLVQIRVERLPRETRRGHGNRRLQQSPIMHSFGAAIAQIWSWWIARISSNVRNSGGIDAISPVAGVPARTARCNPTVPARSICGDARPGGTMTSARPSVEIWSGVCSSMSRSSKMERSMTRARLLPCLLSFLVIIGQVSAN